MQDSIKNRCRICLDVQNLSDISTSDILDKIKYCTTVQVLSDNEVSVKICTKCGYYLNLVHVFRMVCEWADLKLQREAQPTISLNLNNPSYMYVENVRSNKHCSNKHLIEYLLKTQFLETYKYFKNFGDVEACENNNCEEIDANCDLLYDNFIEENSEEDENDFVNEENSFDFIQDSEEEEGSNLLESEVLSEESNLIRESAKTAEEEGIENEENDFYDCETHEGVYNNLIYGNVCLNAEDPLLHNVSDRTNVLESEEADLPIPSAGNKVVEKQITLSNISLDDFENFQKEQLDNSFQDNMTNKNDVGDGGKDSNLNKKAENRVGRHIAKKNAGQPPKRYSPTPEVVNATSTTFQSKPTIPKNTVERKLDSNNISDQDYILENDLSMPDPIFEETIVTDGFYFENEDWEPLEIPEGKIVNQRKKMIRGKRRNKVNVFEDGTVHPKRIKKTIKRSKLEIGTNNSQAQVSVKRKKTKRTLRKGTTCKICNKSFPFPSHLQRHLTAHIGIKRFTCKHCNKEFLHRYNLSVHMRSHTGNFPLECDICNRGFVSSSVLERHKRSHTRETPFQCRYCLQLFSHASSLNMHEKMHLNRPSFPCDVCYKVFSYKSSLNAHKKGHSDFKPHTCNVCHKKFTRRTSVLRHMACHSEVKKFKCRSCGEGFNNQGNLVKHRKVHRELIKD